MSHQDRSSTPRSGQQHLVAIAQDIFDEIATDARSTNSRFSEVLDDALRHHYGLPAPCPELAPKAPAVYCGQCIDALLIHLKLDKILDRLGGWTSEDERNCHQLRNGGDQ
jgi:hypothetical protein